MYKLLLLLSPNLSLCPFASFSLPRGHLGEGERSLTALHASASPTLPCGRHLYRPPSILRGIYKSGANEPLPLCLLSPPSSLPPMLSGCFYDCSRNHAETLFMCVSTRPVHSLPPWGKKVAVVDIHSVWRHKPCRNGKEAQQDER